ncbi:MAG TPA: hypothetical protein VGI06_06235, partial [Acidimicrobiales bacterium]
MSNRPAPKATVKPSQLFLLVGVVLAVLFAASGIAAAIEGWRDPSPVSREVFIDIPGALQVLFYVLVTP